MHIGCTWPRVCVASVSSTSKTEREREREREREYKQGIIFRIIVNNALNMCLSIVPTLSPEVWSQQVVNTNPSCVFLSETCPGTRELIFLKWLP